MSRQKKPSIVEPDESSFSTEEKLLEFYKCRDDPFYFIENYITLELPGKTVKMKLYKPQRKFMTSLLEDHYCIALKSRQIGISTVTQAWIVYTMVFYRNVVVGIISRDGDESTDFCRKVMSMIKELPPWISPKFTKDSERTFILDNGSKFYASQVSLQNPSKTFRGKSITICIIDEAAFIDKIDDAFTGFAPSLFKNQKIAKKEGVPFGTVIISTPNKTTGIGKWFFNRWSEAFQEDGEEDAEKESNQIYVPHKIHWSDVAEFRDDPDWYKTQCAVLHNDPIKIGQELEMKFLASHNSFFPPEIIDILNSVDEKPSSVIEIEKNNLLMWEKPSPQKYYLIGVDIASASGSDKSVIEVIDFVTLEQVAEYVAKMRVDDFCKAVDMVSKIYARNLIIPENNSYGNQLVEYLTNNSSGHFNVYEMTDRKKHSAKKKMKYGISTNASSRPLIIDALYTYIKENPELVRSPGLALELIGLEDNGRGKIEAGKGMHDDRAMALAFACYVRMYDAPLSVATAMANEVVDDIADVIDMNMEGGGLPAKMSNLRHENELNQNAANKALQSHIKKNFDKIIEDNQNGGVIDITSMLSFDYPDSDNSEQK